MTMDLFLADFMTKGVILILKLQIIPVWIVIYQRVLHVAYTNLAL